MTKIELMEAMKAMPDDTEILLDTLIPTGKVCEADLFSVHVQTGDAAKGIKDTIRLTGTTPRTKR
jgi:hypothetical protein